MTGHRERAVQDFQARRRDGHDPEGREGGVGVVIQPRRLPCHVPASASRGGQRNRNNIVLHGQAVERGPDSQLGNPCVEVRCARRRHIFDDQSPTDRCRGEVRTRVVPVRVGGDRRRALVGPACGILDIRDGNGVVLVVGRRPTTAAEEAARRPDSELLRGPRPAGPSSTRFSCGLLLLLHSHQCLHRSAIDTAGSAGLSRSGRPPGQRNDAADCRTPAAYRRDLHTAV